MNGWKKDKRWSDKFLTEMKRIIGANLISEPPVEEDQERNTDLIVLKLDAIRIACRIRRNKYLKWSDEFTVRAGRPSGVKTEMAKIIEGWGDYVFYGFCDESETCLSKWIIGDLKAFRLWYMQQLYKTKIPPGTKQQNGDKSSWFLAFKTDIPRFVMASS